jgi:hypothetical protein
MRVKVILALIQLICTQFVITQSDNTFVQDRKGYLGLSIGPSFPIGLFGSQDIYNTDAGLASTGLNINLVNFGYTFGKHFGIAGSWLGGAHSIDYNYGENPMWSYGGIFVGALVSFPLSDKVIVDIRLMPGYMLVIKAAPYAYVSDFEGEAFGMDLGAVLRVKISNRWCIPLHLDYLSSKPTLKYEDDRFEYYLKVISITSGIAYRLR